MVNGAMQGMTTHKLVRAAIFGACLVPAFGARAQADFDKLLAHYAQAGGRGFSAERGRSFWQEKRAAADAKTLSCSKCHGAGAELRRSGKHYKSGKVIEPMAPSVNKERYTDMEKLEKWFTRNCKQVIKRECSPQEKGDVLRYLSQF
jgi:hypothetical protein